MKLAVCLAWLLMGCSGGGGGTLLVRFHSGRSIPGQADALDVLVSSSDGTLLRRQSYDLAGLSGFPATLEIVRGATTPADVRIEAYVHLGTRIVAAASRDAAFVADSQPTVDIPLVDVPGVRATSSGISSGAPSLAIERPAMSADGDVLVAVVAHDSGTSFLIPPPSGWTYVSTLTDNVGFGVRTYVFWKVASAAEPSSYSFMPTPAYSGEMVGGIWSIEAANAAAPIDMSAVQAGAATMTCTTRSIDTTAPSLLLYACAKSNSTTAFTLPPPTRPTDLIDDWDRASSATSTSMVMVGAHAVEPSTGATGTRSSSSINTNASGEIATLLAIVAPPPQRIAGDQPEDPMPCFFSSL